MSKPSRLRSALPTVVAVAAVAFASVLAIQLLTDFGVSSVSTVRQSQSERAADQVRSLELTLSQLRQQTATFASDNPRLRQLLKRAESDARRLRDGGREAAMQSAAIEARGGLAIGLVVELALLACLGAVRLSRKRDDDDEAPPLRIITPPPSAPAPEECREAA